MPNFSLNLPNAMLTCVEVGLREGAGGGFGRRARGKCLELHAWPFQGPRLKVTDESEKRIHIHSCNKNLC